MDSSSASRETPPVKIFSHTYPPPLSEEQLANLIFTIKDWQITHGMLLKHGPDAHSISCTPIGVSLFPTPFPRPLFERAQKLQPIYNKLYAAISEDEEWLEGALRGLIDEGLFAAVLWGIHQEVKAEGYVQDAVLGIFRSDYMIDLARTSNSAADDSQMGFRQIEFNTFSAAGGVHAAKVAEMHRFLLKSGSYNLPSNDHHFVPLAESKLPENNTINLLAAGILDAHAAYCGSKHMSSTTPGVLFVVQPRNGNICDERPLEYALLQHDPPIPVYRVIFGAQVLSQTTVSPSRELLYHSPTLATPIEIAVVYMRAGYDFEEYSPSGIDARRQLERSRAIKCPSILCHLATFKKVQQELAMPGILERFLAPEEAALVSETFAPMYPLDGLSKAGQTGQELACHPKTAIDYVLKPSLEGGGHNTYRLDIPELLGEIPESQWQGYILMKLVNPLVQKNILLTSRGYYDNVIAMEDKMGDDPEIERAAADIDPLLKKGGPTVSELGVFGVCLWRRSDHGSNEILRNYQAGWSFKTKPDYVDEMSVVKGYGCFDSPLLVDDPLDERYQHCSA